MGPNTKLVLTFDDGNFKALVMVGCAKVSARTNATGEIATDQGSLGKTDPASGGDIEVQYQPGTTPAVGQGVCPTGGGAVPPSDAGASGGQGGLFGLGHGRDYSYRRRGYGCRTDTAVVPGQSERTLKLTSNKIRVTT